jgi:hypothetical protein
LVTFFAESAPLRTTEMERWFVFAAEAGPVTIRAARTVAIRLVMSVMRRIGVSFARVRRS